MKNLLWTATLLAAVIACDGKGSSSSVNAEATAQTGMKFDEAARRSYQSCLNNLTRIVKRPFYKDAQQNLMGAPQEVHTLIERSEVMQESLSLTACEAFPGGRNCFDTDEKSALTKYQAAKGSKTDKPSAKGSVHAALKSIYDSPQRSNYHSIQWSQIDIAMRCLGGEFNR